MIIMSKVDSNRLVGEKTGGRTKGTPNKKTLDVIDRLNKLKCDPIEGMARIAMNDVPCDTCEETGRIKIDETSDVELCPTCNGAGKLFSSVELRGQMYKELAQYVAPKRKAVEISGNLDHDHKHEHRTVSETLDFVEESLRGGTESPSEKPLSH